jgi:hypothetical protein
MDGDVRKTALVDIFITQKTKEVRNGYLAMVLSI